MKKRLVFAVSFVLLFIIGLSGRPLAGEKAVREYVVGGGDVLEVNVWKSPDLSRVVSVRPDGKITLPLLRDVDAVGKTPVQLGEELTEKLVTFINDPNVTVTVKEAKSYRVYTQGAVAVVGAFPLAGPMTVSQLYSLAGGPVEGADPEKSFVMRWNTKLPVNLLPDPEVVLGMQSVEVKPGDILVVPFHEAARRVLVVGEVKTPVALQYREGMTVLDAYAEAGGGTEFAKLNAVKIMRESGDDGEKKIEVNVEKIIKKGNREENVLLAPGDIVAVP